jgi:zinc D-Ala-D-Ala dipeptidase
MTAVLTDPRVVNAPSVHDAPPLPHCELPTNPVPIRESGQALVRLTRSIQAKPCYFEANWPASIPDCLVRDEVNSRLLRAQGDLLPDMGLVVLDGWRSPVLQRELYESAYGRGGLKQPGYVSEPGGPLQPPHTTGGAVDITLSWRGTPLALGTDFDDFTPAALADSLENDPDAEPERSLRRLLTSVLINHGFSNYPLEWWHFSFGDQIWAHNRGKPFAIYGGTDSGEGHNGATA